MEIELNSLKKIFPVFLFVIVASISIALLVGVESTLRADLELSQDQETMDLVRQIFPQADSYIYDDEAEIYTVYKGRSQIGYAAYGKDHGYRGRLIVLAGITDTETIQGAVVIEQYDDDSYWDMLEEADFFSKFVGLEIEECHPSYSWLPGGVDVVTRASSSCMGVVRATKKAALAIVESIG
jgi:Na+-translocating ferredoxin:NAD+ oxidoreductase RnfG subunit